MEDRVECPRCEGSGRVYYPTGLGEGSRIPCNDCQGTGQVTEEEHEEIFEQIRYEHLID